MYCHLPFLVTAWLFNLICDHYHIMVTIVPLWSTVANNRLILCSFSFVIHFHSFLLCSPPIAACTYFVYKDYVANKARQLISFIQPLFLFVPKFASLPRISISSIRISLPLTTLCGLVFLVSFPLKLCVSLWARVSVLGLHFLCIFIAACARLLHFCVDIVAATLLSLPDSVHHCKNPWTSCVRRCFWFHVFFGCCAQRHACASPSPTFRGEACTRAPLFQLMPLSLSIMLSLLSKAPNMLIVIKGPSTGYQTPGMYSPVSPYFEDVILFFFLFGLQLECSLQSCLMNHVDSNSCMHDHWTDYQHASWWLI